MYGKKTGSKLSNTDLGSALNIHKERREDVQVTVKKSEDMLIGLMLWRHRRHRQVQKTMAMLRYT